MIKVRDTQQTITHVLIMERSMNYLQDILIRIRFNDTARAFRNFFVFLNEKKARITQYGFIAVLQSAGTKQGHSNGYISKNENRMLDFNTHEINFNRLLKF